MIISYIVTVICTEENIVEDLGENGLPIKGWIQSSLDFHIGTKYPFSIKFNISL